MLAPSLKPTVESQQQRIVWPELDSLVLSALAIIVVQIFRSEHHDGVLLLVLQTCLCGAIPWLLRLTLRPTVPNNNGMSIVVGATLLCSSLPFAIQPAFRMLNHGDALEVLMLIAAADSAWVLAVFSDHPGFRRSSFILSSAVVLLVSFVAANNLIIFVLASYLVLAAVWLMRSYWRPLDNKALFATRSGQGIHWPTLVVLSCLVAVAVGLVRFDIYATAASAINGFMPTSGGGRWSNDNARKGIGDGNMLTAGENATTTGAVDSDQFIEDDKPSIYDMMSDQFDEPVIRRKRRNRAVSLSEMAKHIEKVRQSEQSGKTFRTVRKAGKKQQPRELQDRISEALCYVEGSLPARLSLGSFNHFDGWDWTCVPVEPSVQLNPRLTIQQEFGKPWFKVNKVERDFLKSQRKHKVKLLRLDTRTLPAPSMLHGWHIFRVELLDLFNWGDDGLVKMDGECIPSQTVIETQSHVPDLFELRWRTVWKNLASCNDQVSQAPSSQPHASSRPSVYLQLPENDAEARLRDLAREWTAGIPQGWQQIEAIVTRLREDFAVDPNNVPPSDCSDSVSHFLTTRSGPSYLFATTATQLLRAAGYEARLVTGLLVQEQDYVATAGQSIVTKENLHLWPEVRFDAWHWIPVEPTPGMPHPYHQFSLIQMLQHQVYALLSAVKSHPLMALLGVVIASLLIAYRTDFISAGIWICWVVGFRVFPSRRIDLTRRLIDVRFWAAGLSRPVHVSVSHWCEEFGADAGRHFGACWNRSQFRPGANRYSCPIEIKQTCQAAADCFSFQNVKQIAKQYRGRQVDPGDSNRDWLSLNFVPERA